MLEQIAGSSRGCGRNTHENIKNRKTELKKTEIVLVVLSYPNIGDVMSVKLYYTQNVRGFQQESVKYFLVMRSLFFRKSLGKIAVKKFDCRNYQP
jgi:hypothetical protein